MTERTIFLYFFTKLKKLAIYLHQGLVVQGVDKAIYRINFYSEDGSLCFDDTDLIDGDLYIVWCYSLFEEQGPGPPLPTSWREVTTDYNFLIFFFLLSPLVFTCWIGDHSLYFMFCQVSWSQSNEKENHFSCWSNKQWQDSCCYWEISCSQLWSLLWSTTALSSRSVQESKLCCKLKQIKKLLQHQIYFKAFCSYPCFSLRHQYPAEKPSTLPLLVSFCCPLPAPWFSFCFSPFWMFFRWLVLVYDSSLFTWFR